MLAGARQNQGGAWTATLASSFVLGSLRASFPSLLGLHRPSPRHAHAHAPLGRLPGQEGVSVGEGVAWTAAQPGDISLAVGAAAAFLVVTGTVQAK